MEPLRIVDKRLSKEDDYPRFVLNQFPASRTEIEVNYNGWHENIVINRPMVRSIRNMLFRGTSFRIIYNSRSWSH